jgi:hypothetical protein
LKIVNRGPPGAAVAPMQNRGNMSATKTLPARRVTDETPLNVIYERCMEALLDTTVLNEESHLKLITTLYHAMDDALLACIKEQTVEVTLPHSCAAASLLVSTLIRHVKQEAMEVAARTVAP